jgi:hypothetical protein
LLERLASAQLALGQAQRARAGQAIALLADDDLVPARPAPEEHSTGGWLGELLHAADGNAAEEPRIERTVPSVPRGGNEAPR